MLVAMGSVPCTIRDGTDFCLCLGVTVRLRFQDSRLGSLRNAHSWHRALLSLCSPHCTAKGAQEMGFITSLHPSLPQPYPMAASFPGLLNCFECCRKWIILKWKSGQIWFGLETTQGYKRSRWEGLGSLCFLCFRGAQTGLKENCPYPESKHVFSKKTWKSTLINTWTIESPSSLVKAKCLEPSFHLENLADKHSLLLGSASALWDPSV